MATISKSVTVADGGVYTIELNAIPNGSTVTPVNDIQTWLHCANIWNKTYTTIAQVLADAGAVQSLIASNNATDYMARSTSWASSVCGNSNAMVYIGANNYCANKLLADSTWRNAICNSTYFESVLNYKVPSMTSYNTPSGTVAASSEYGGYPAWKAFDGNPSSVGWYAAGSSGTSGWIDYTFPTPTRLYKMRASASQRGVVTNITVYGYNNTTSQFDLLVNSFETGVGATDKIVQASRDYARYRANCTFPNYSYSEGVKLQYFSRKS